jgi:uncharacterized membrane protein
MEEIYHRTLAYLKYIKNKIAFYPTVFALMGIFLAFLMMYIEGLGISQHLLKNFPALMVEDGATALTILSALITGLISMMVFSFSMVMLLLSQASSNYSPRLLPGLISDKVHQIILGIYLATILYLIFILFSIHPSEDKYTIPGFSVLIGIIATVLCIYSFIYFIHNISQSIQINNILDEIYTLAKNRLHQLIKNEKGDEPEFPNDDEWYEYHTNTSGYLQNLAINPISEICLENNTQIIILPVKGIFVLKGLPLFKSRKKLDDEVVKNLISHFIFARGELVGDNYLLGFKQITEIIVKAMSPGINDPGTAINGIDYLTELFYLRLKKRDNSFICKDGIALIKLNNLSFEVLLYNVMASIRTYCKHDIILVQKLLVMFKYLKNENVQNKVYVNCIEVETRNLLEDVKEAIPNRRDVEIAFELAGNYGLLSTT